MSAAPPPAVDWPSMFVPLKARLEADLAAAYATSAVRLTPLAHHARPFSHVLQVGVSDADRGPIARAFVKILTPKADLDATQMRTRVGHEFVTTRDVHERLRDIDDLGTVRPLVHYPESLVVVTEEVPGQTLSAILEERARWRPSPHALAWLERVLGTVGTWIRQLQQAFPSTGHVSLDDLRAYVDVRLHRLVASPRAGFDATMRQRVLRHVDALGDRIVPGDLEAVLAHADLATGNVIVDDRRVTVLDFAMAHRGTRLQDLTRLHMQLDLLCAKPWFRRRTMSRLQAALHRGFDPSLSEASPLFRLQSMIHRVNNLASLATRTATVPAALYNAHVRRLHRRWIVAELGHRTSEGSR